VRRNSTRPKTCTVCGRAVSDSFVCRRCGRELRELLIGNGWPTRPGNEPNQPGIIWYLHRLHETAYRQDNIERRSRAADAQGYALLIDQRATLLIARITATVGNWSDVLDRLTASQSDEIPVDQVMPLDDYRIRRIANNIPVLRHNCADLDRLLHHLLDYAKEAWRIINRPDDICCGPCPAKVKDENGDEIDCARILYAEEYYEEGEGRCVTAETVQCSRCRARHNVSELRQRLVRETRETLFTGPELLALMANRLNDRMPRSTFYQLVKDGRLRERGYRVDVPLYTYADVCEARDKPKPRKTTKDKVG
jgi:hypothetical protein